jgi:hypothetical protein
MDKQYRSLAKLKQEIQFYETAMLRKGISINPNVLDESS